ncbi:hypothetical protein JCM11251_004807 [Rhodosporidiobolus azoricus]
MNPDPPRESSAPHPHSSAVLSSNDLPDSVPPSPAPIIHGSRAASEETKSKDSGEDEELAEDDERKPYALPSPLERKGATRKQEEAAWASIFAEEKPMFDGGLLPFKRCAERNSLSPIQTLSALLKKVPSPLTHSLLKEHQTTLEQLELLLDGDETLTRHAWTAISSSASSSSSAASSSAAALLAEDDPSPPSGSMQFTRTALPEQDSKQDPLRLVESRCMVTEKDIAKRPGKAHGLSAKSETDRLMFALKMYSILASRTVLRDFHINHISNVMFLDKTIHDHFDHSGLLILPNLDFLTYLQSYLSTDAAPFNYEVFLDHLRVDRPDLLPSVLTYQVIGLQPDETSVIPVVDGHGIFYTCEADGIFRYKGSHGPATELPPRRFFRTEQPTVPDPYFNPFLLLIDGAKKLVKSTSAGWPAGHDDLFLLVLDIFLTIFRRIEYDDDLYLTAVRTAAYWVEKDKPKRKRFVDEEEDDE